MTDLTLINAALTRTGNEPISSLNSTDIGAQIASNTYEEIVKAELAAYPWKRATKTTQLSYLDPDDVGDPPEPWAAAYQLPDDLVEIRDLRVGGVNVNYTVFGDTLLTESTGSTDEVWLRYIWRPEEATWPSWFREGIIRRMEAVFLRSIGERYKEAAERDQQAELQLARARNRDSQSGSPRDPWISNLLKYRGGLTNLGRTGETWDDYINGRF